MSPRMNGLIPVIICILQCQAVSISIAQPAGGIFYHLTTISGLSSNRVNSVIQDQEGFYWIATSDGLNRFDGSNCKVFMNTRNDSTSLSHNNCLYLLEDDKGDIWIATPRGVNRYDKKTQKFEQFYLSHPALLADQVNAVKGMAKDEKGNIWIASAGLWQFNIYLRQWTRYLHDARDLSSVPEGVNFWLQYDKFNKGLWMGNNGLVFFDIEAGKFYYAGNDPKKMIPVETTVTSDFFILDSTGLIWFYRDPGVELCSYSPKTRTLRHLSVKNPGSVYSCSVDAENRIWFNHWNKGTYIFDPGTNKFDTTFLAYAHEQSPLSTIATHLYIDREGNYWISSSKGVSIYNPRAQGVRYILLSDQKKFSRDIAITCIAEQNENTLWVGTEEGLFRYNQSEKKFSDIIRLPLSSPDVRRLYIQGDSILWIGGSIELLLFDLRSERVLKKIAMDANPQFITNGERNDVWVGTWSHGLFKFSSSGQLIDRLTERKNVSASLQYNGLTCFATSMKESSFWAGYNFEHGFFKFNYKDHSIENFKIPVTSHYINTSNSVNAIEEDEQGNVWLGTYGAGLVYFDRKNHSFTTYTQNDGLKGNYINKILLDDQFNIWVTTSNGLSVIDSRTHSIINSEIDLSFRYNDFVSNSIRCKNGNFLFFSGLKIVEINPASYLQGAYPSKILLSSFKIFEKETSLKEKKTGLSGIHLSYRQNFFSFEYSLLKLNPQSSTQYAYRLEGFDENWNNAGERRTAYYTNVPPGTYEFRVKATDGSGKWIYFSNPVVITISPPFWKTWWFYLSVALLIAGSVLYFVRDRIKQFKKREQERLRLIVATQEQEKKNISAELHDDLGVRLSALKYFVTSLKQYLSTDEEAAKETYDRTIATIDESVEDIRYLLINLSPKTLNEYGYLTAVEDLANKLSRLHIIKVNLQQRGIGQRFHPDIEAGLYRITQELINNTLKHAGAGTINLLIEKTNGMIRLEYVDDGKGFELLKNGKGYGIENIHTRVALMNGKIEWDTSRFTKVLITIPCNHT